MSSRVNPNEAPTGFVAVSAEGKTCLDCAYMRTGCETSGLCARESRRDGCEVVFVLTQVKQGHHHVQTTSNFLPTPPLARGVLVHL